MRKLSFSELPRIYILTVSITVKCHKWASITKQRLKLKRCRKVYWVIKLIRTECLTNWEIQMRQNIKRMSCFRSLSSKEVTFSRVCSSIWTSTTNVKFQRISWISAYPGTPTKCTWVTFRILSEDALINKFILTFMS